MSLPAANPIRSDDGALLSIVYAAVPLRFRKGTQWASPEDFIRDYDNHRGKTDGSDEGSGREDEEGLDRDELLEKDLLSAEAGDGGDLYEEALRKMRTVITTAGHDVAVSKKGYTELLRSFSTVMQAVRSASQAASHVPEVQKVKVGELEQKGQFVTDAAKKTADLQIKMVAEEAELAFTKSVMNTKEGALKTRFREFHQLSHDLESARAVVG